MEEELCNACEEGNLEKVQDLLEIKSDLNVNWGSGGLHLACRDGHSSIVSLLLEHPDIDVNQKDIDGDTPFYYSCYHRQGNVVQLLLKDGRVLINEPDYVGETPLSRAAYNGSYEIIQWMVASGRELDLGEPGNEYSDAIAQAAEIETWDDEDHKLAKVKVAELLERYKKNRRKTVEEVRIDLGIKASFTHLTELNLNWNNLSSLPPWSSPLSLCLQNVQVLSLCGMEDLALGVLSAWLNESAVTDLDLSYTRSLWNSPERLPPLIDELRDIKRLRLRGCPMVDKGKDDNDATEASKTANRGKNSRFALAIIKSLLTNEGHSFETVDIEWYVELLQEDASELSTLPAEIRQKSAQLIIQYVLDLKKGGSVSLSRTKLMVVGYEKVGKTNLLECLFPLKTAQPLNMTITTSRMGTQRREQQALVEITGQKELILRLLSSTASLSLLPSVKSTLKVHLGDGQWTLTSLSPSSPGVATQIELNRRLQPARRQTSTSSPDVITRISLSVVDATEGTELVKRLRRICGDDRTHGIEIQKQVIPIPPSPTSPSSLSSSSSSSSLSSYTPEDLELNVWDFGGQESYYNNHHYFLSARSVFLVVWNVLEGEKGVRGLDFWLKSLKAHLPPVLPNEKPPYSIIVVGTHIDGIFDADKSLGERRAHISDLFAQVYGAEHSLSFDYIEVSSLSGLNIPQLHSKIVETALGHSYMGELVPQSYLDVEAEVAKVKFEKHQTEALPVADVEGEFLPRLSKMDGGEVKRALSLLHLWGGCVYFGDSPVLSQAVVVDPSFLTQSVLGMLFHFDFASAFPSGQIHHRLLKLFWPKYTSRAEYLMNLMEKYEVCFDLHEKGKDGIELPFWDRHSVITAYLPVDPPSNAFNLSVWPIECPKDTAQLQRVYSFNIVPKELVSRLLVRLHYQMEEKAIWKSGLYLESASHGVKVLMRASTEKNTLEATVRGGEIGVSQVIMDTIVMELEAVIKNYAGITTAFKENVVNSGLEGKKWWEFSPNTEWEKKGASFDGTAAHSDSVDGENWIQLLPIVQNGVEKEGELAEKLKLALDILGGDFHDVDEAFSLYNPASLKMFEGFRDNLLAKQIKTPSLFTKTTWKSMNELEVRDNFMEEHEKHLARFDWNETEKLKVSLMAQGTTSEAAWGIAQGGFGLIASPDDQGWFGKGIYMTSSLKYAHSYAEKKARDSAKTAAVLICATVPGNVFPVVDMSLNGRPGLDGYQSHFTIVDFDQFPYSEPLLDFQGKPNAVDELVFFQESQTLPLFIVRLKSRPAFFTCRKPARSSSSHAPTHIDQSSGQGNRKFSKEDFEIMSREELIRLLIASEEENALLRRREKQRPKDPEEPKEREK